MSLGLHEKCQEQLRQRIAAGLPEINVMHQMFIESWSGSELRKAEATIPQGELRKKLEKYVGEDAIVDFVSERVSKELSDMDRYDTSSPDAVPLTELDEYKDSKAVAERLVRELESLPWDYVVTLRMRNDFGQMLVSEINGFRLSESISLVEANEGFRKEFPACRDKAKETGFASIASTLFDLTERMAEWDPTSAYFQIRVSGFIGHYGLTPPLQQAVDAIKTLCGLGIALRLLRRKYSHRGRTVRARCTVHRRIEDKWAVERTHDLKPDLSAALDDLVFDDHRGGVRQDQRVLWLKDALGRVASVFQEGERAEKIALAAQWLFDSYCGDNDLLAFVQTTVAMEIMLGDKATSEATGLGRLLSNRCAYLIGKSQSERERVLEDFAEIYDVRSQIVHRGKSRLNGKERELFATFRQMCHRVIEEEVNLLRADLATERAIKLELSLRRLSSET